jgi:AraC family transcriptional regulator
MSAKPSAAPLEEPSQLSVRLVTDPPGKTKYAAFPRTIVAIHVGRAVYMSCSRGGLKHQGLGVHGDIDIVPPETPTVWEPKDYDTVVALGLESEIMHAAAEEAGGYPDRLEMRNRCQIRDPQIEHIGWALKAEMEAGYPNGKLFRDSLATALAASLLNRHSSLAKSPDAFRRSFAGHRLKQVLAYIEDNLSSDLSLRELAAVAGVSPSHCKVIFRESMGVSMHQYVVQRRVERARTLLSQTDLAVSEIALRVGFAHQSHLATHMKRLFAIHPELYAKERSSTNRRQHRPKIEALASNCPYSRSNSSSESGR